LHSGGEGDDSGAGEIVAPTVIQQNNPGFSGPAV
jgi:hypothetical protein